MNGYAQEFDWSRDAESVVVKEQLAIAVYENADGNIVIRQMAWPDDDDVIIVARSNVPALIRALLKEAGVAEAEPPALPAPPKSNAERQRQYRERHAGNDRNGSDAARVTRNADETQCNAARQASLLDEAAE